MEEKLAEGKPVHPSVLRVVEGRVMPAPHLVADWNAYWFLSQCRPSGFGPSPIPLTEILAFAGWKRIEGEELDDLVRNVKVLDTEFLTFVAETAKPKKDAQ